MYLCNVCNRVLHIVCFVSTCSRTLFFCYTSYLLFVVASVFFFCMQPLNLDLKIEKIFIANFFLVVVVMLFVTNMLFLCCCCCLLLVLLLLLLSSYVFSIICIYDHDDAAANSQSFIESMCLFSWLTRHILVMPSN